MVCGRGRAVVKEITSANDTLPLRELGRALSRAGVLSPSGQNAWSRAERRLIRKLRTALSRGKRGAATAGRVFFRFLTGGTRVVARPLVQSLPTVARTTTGILARTGTAIRLTRVQSRILLRRLYRALRERAAKLAAGAGLAATGGATAVVAYNNLKPEEPNCSNGKNLPPECCEK